MLRATLDMAMARPAATKEGSESAVSALRHLALLLCQAGEDEEATLQLGALGSTYRLSRAVLHYARAPAMAHGAGGGAEGSCFAVDNVLPPALLGHMQTALAPTSAFWREHGYDVHHRRSRPYFSYLHPLYGFLAKPATFLEQLLARVHRVALGQMPAVAEAQFVEWWTHCWPHCSGHQMHFDSEDEGMGGVRHPICSTVLYLTPAGLGGPTLITDQTVASSQLAACGWLAHPRENRLAGFDGRLLHGVVPGRGAPAPAAVSASACGEIRALWRAHAPEKLPNLGAAVAKYGAEKLLAMVRRKYSGVTVAGSGAESPAGPRRVTFMVAFWRGPMSTAPQTDELPGSSQPIPTPAACARLGYTWPRLFATAAPVAEVELGPDRARRGGPRGDRPSLAKRGGGVAPPGRRSDARVRCVLPRILASATP
jgi:hypothetical protein